MIIKIVDALKTRLARLQGKTVKTPLPTDNNNQAHQKKLVSPTLEIIGWHGGWGNFKSVQSEHLGTGEGNAMGRGFYFSEFQEGAIYYAKFQLRGTERKIGYVHKVRLSIMQHELWDIDNESTASNERDVIKYKDKLSKQLDQEAANELLASGTKAIKTYEGNQPSHGLTYIVFDPACISILESYELDSTSLKLLPVT